MRQINETSGYWLGTDLEDKYYDPLTGEYNKPSGKDLFALSGYRRAIGNFVRIVTGENIPVEFKGDDSYTDGKQVVLSSNIKTGNFDVSVGLALHEGSHIKLTDFSHLKRGLENYIPSMLVEKFESKGLSKYHAIDTVKNLLNVVEDRRIDKFIQDTAPGYRGYYEAMYDYYFNDKIIDKALITQQWCENKLEHYMNHIINFINPNRTLDLLPGLRAVWNELNLRNINRLKNTDEALTVALNMAEIIVDNIDTVVEEDTPPAGGNAPGEGEDKEMTLKDKIANNLQTLGKALTKMPNGDPREVKVLEQIGVLTEMWDEVKNN